MPSHTSVGVYYQILFIQAKHIDQLSATDPPKSVIIFIRTAPIIGSKLDAINILRDSLQNWTTETESDYQRKISFSSMLFST